MEKVFHFENILIIKHFQNMSKNNPKIVFKIIGHVKKSSYFCHENPRNEEILSTDFSSQIS